MAPPRLSEQLRIDVDEARSYIHRFFISLPEVKECIDGVHALVQRDGYVMTKYGRHRQLPGIQSGDRKAVAEAQRQAVNTIVQGTAADIFKLALIRLHNLLPPTCRLLLPLHDAVLLEVPEAELEEVECIVREAMETSPPGFEVPLVIKMGSGPNWAACSGAGIGLAVNAAVN